MNYRKEVEPPTPELPPSGIINKSAYFREFLLTKCNSILLCLLFRSSLTLKFFFNIVINAEFCSNSSDKLRQMMASFRTEHLLKMQELYPREKKAITNIGNVPASTIPNPKKLEYKNLIGLTDDASTAYYLDQKTLSRFVKKIREEKENQARPDNVETTTNKKWYKV